MATMKTTVKRASSTNPPKMVLRSTSNKVLTIHRMPREVAHTNHGQVWSESERAGRQAVVRRTAEKVPEFSFSYILGSRDHQKSIAADLNRLDMFARSKAPMTVTYTSQESGVYHIMDYTYTIEMRNAKTNEPTRATVELTLRKTIKDSIKTGTVKKPAKKKPVKKKVTKKKKPTKKKKVVKYKVKKGDTLWDLARKYYKNPYKWRKIADKNKVKNPRLLRIGKVLIIP